MKKARDRSVGGQVKLLFGLICAVLVIVGALYFFSLRSIEHEIPLEQTRSLDELMLIEDTTQSAAQIQAAVLQEIVANNPIAIQGHDQIVQEMEKANDRRLDYYQANYIYSDEEKQLFDNVTRARKVFLEQAQKARQLALVNRDAAAARLIDATEVPAYENYLKETDALTDYVEGEAKESVTHQARFISRSRTIGDELIVVALLVVIGTGFSVIRIARRLKEDNLELLTEVAERKQAEESLQLFRSAVEQSKESIVITDAHLDSPGPTIIYVNSAFTHMTGYTRLEALGRTPRMLQGPRTDRAVLERLRHNLKEGEIFEGETINYRKDGSEFDIEWQVAPIRHAGGSITHFVAIQRDITERKQIEGRLFQSQKMETVGKLAGGVAHEFNSILTAIIGQSELLLTDLPAKDPLVKNAGEIHEAARRAAVLTRQLLAYGRKQLLAPEILNLNVVLHDMTGMLRHLVGDQIDVRIIPASGLRPVKIDPGQMEQVIVNIAMNAAEVMPNGGKLTLETANVVLDEDYVRPFGIKAGDYVMLAMSDMGPGMSDEVKARAFEPFFSTKEVGRGTGLGLATCYGIIKQSEGHIAVYSELGRGTTLKIYLPQVEERVTSTSSRAAPSELPRGTETILMAEDDPSLLEMSAALLRRLGYTVLTAENGVDALSMKQPPDLGPIDLLYTDVVMPHMSGKELSDRIRTIYPKAKILFTSAYTENAIVHQGMLKEGVMLLQKPFTPMALASKIREVLDVR